MKTLIVIGLGHVDDAALSSLDTFQILFKPHGLFSKHYSFKHMHMQNYMVVVLTIVSIKWVTGCGKSKRSSLSEYFPS